MTSDGRRFGIGDRDQGSGHRYALLRWAVACAATLEVSRRTWRGLRDRMPRGYGRQSFVVPAVAITGTFLAGAWWLKSRTQHEDRKDHKDHEGEFV